MRPRKRGGPLGSLREFFVFAREFVRGSGSALPPQPPPTRERPSSRTGQWIVSQAVHLHWLGIPLPIDAAHEQSPGLPKGRRSPQQGNGTGGLRARSATARVSG